MIRTLLARVNDIGSWIWHDLSLPIWISSANNRYLWPVSTHRSAAHADINLKRQIFRKLEPAQGQVFFAKKRAKPVCDGWLWIYQGLWLEHRRRKCCMISDNTLDSSSDTLSCRRMNWSCNFPSTDMISHRIRSWFRNVSLSFDSRLYRIPDT